jgi:hypothetical protein
LRRRADDSEASVGSLGRERVAVPVARYHVRRDDGVVPSTCDDQVVAASPCGTSAPATPMMLTQSSFTGRVETILFSCRRPRDNGLFGGRGRDWRRKGIGKGLSARARGSPLDGPLRHQKAQHGAGRKGVALLTRRKENLNDPVLFQRFQHRLLPVTGAVRRLRQDEPLDLLN